jgi:hypothetical protein
MIGPGEAVATEPSNVTVGLPCGRGPTNCAVPLFVFAPGKTLGSALLETPAAACLLCFVCATTISDGNSNSPAATNRQKFVIPTLPSRIATISGKDCRKTYVHLRKQLSTRSSARRVSRTIIAV